jgi:hypothetical protein
MSGQLEIFDLRFEREIDFGKIDGWFTGSVNAYVRRSNEKKSIGSFLGECCGDEVKEIFCRFWVGLPLSDENSGSIYFCLDIVVDDVVVVFDKRVVDSSWTWLKYHKVSVPIASIVGEKDSEDVVDLEYEVHKASIESIINEFLIRYKGEIVGTGRTVHAVFFGEEGVFLGTAEVTF